MTRNHKSSYSSKHPPDMTIDPTVADAVAAAIAGGKITCPAAFSLAAEHTAEPSVIGAAIDLQEGRITKCQLGLFGSGPGPSPLKGADRVDDDLKAAITALMVDNRLPCKLAWQIADERKLSRIAVAMACESLNIRINQCQLGAF